MERSTLRQSGGEMEQGHSVCPRGLEFVMIGGGGREEKQTLMVSKQSMFSISLILRALRRVVVIL